MVSALTRVEVPSALARKHRMGELSLSSLTALLAQFETEFPAFLPIPVDPSLLEHAARLVATHQLRAYDAVQLASALAARAADPACDHFAGFDRPLRDAAMIEGFTLVPPNVPGG